MSALWTPSGRAPPGMSIGPGTGRNLATVMRTQGPFQGVDLSRDPRELGPMYAEVAHNVHCAHGAIERRPGIELVADGALPAKPEAIYHHSSATGDETTEWYAAAIFDGERWKIYRLRSDQTVWELIYTQDEDMTGQRHLRPSFYRVSKDYVLVTMAAAHCFGLGRDGTTIPAGATMTRSMDDFNVVLEHKVYALEADTDCDLIVPDGFADTIWAYYWFTYLRRQPEGVHENEYWPFLWETNAAGPAQVSLAFIIPETNPSGKRMWIGFSTGNLDLIKEQGATHMRIYRQFYVPAGDHDGTEDGVITEFSPTRRQIYAMPLPDTVTDPSTYSYDPAADDSDGYYDIPLDKLQGDTIIWDGCGDTYILNESVVPTRNAQPPKGCMLAGLHQNKMFYARIPDTLITASRPRGEDRMYYSAESEYFHVAEKNFMVVGEDGRPITGLMTYFGHLLFFKESEVWALRGSLDQATNLSDALGDAPPWGTHELALVARGVGCVAVMGGPAVLEAGNLLYFVGQGGLYVYNGQIIAEVSQAIAPALRGLTVETMAGSQLAHDPINKLIYWFVGSIGTPAPGQGPEPLLAQHAGWHPLVWVYHYADATDQGGGRWTHWGSFGGNNAPLSCIASRQTSILAQPPGPQLVLGLPNKRVGQTANVHTDTIDAGYPQPIDWAWHGAELTFGSPERAVHWHYITAQFDEQDDDAAEMSVHLNGSVVFPPTTPPHSLAFDLFGGDGQVKWRLGLRSRTLAARFAGESQNAPVRITGFQIDALPIGSR